MVKNKSKRGLAWSIKELVRAFSCAYIELWMHLGSLESTQEARVASFVLSKVPEREPII